jgi:hypothetical protein
MSLINQENMENFARERETFDSFLKFFEDNRISSDKKMKELEKVSNLLQRISSGKEDELKKITNEEVLKYIDNDMERVKRLNIYFQKNVQKIKNQSASSLDEKQEKMIKFDFTQFINKFGDSDKISASIKLITLLQKISSSKEFNSKILSEKDFIDIKPHCLNILKFIEKNKQVAPNAIKIFQKLAKEIQSNLSKASLFSIIYDSGVNLNSYYKFLEFIKVNKARLDKLNHDLVKKKIPVIFFYPICLNDEHNIKIDFSDVLIFLFFNFDENTVEIICPSDKIPITVKKINAIIENFNCEFFNIEDFIFDEKIKKFGAIEDIRCYLDCEKLVSFIKEKISSALPYLNFKIPEFEKFSHISRNSNNHSNQMSLKLKACLDEMKDKILVSYEKEILHSLIQKIKYLSTNLLILNFDSKEKIISFECFEKIYQAYKSANDNLCTVSLK